MVPSRSSHDHLGRAVRHLLPVAFIVGVVAALLFRATNGYVIAATARAASAAS